MTGVTLSPVLAGLGLGLAQAVRGGVGRGFRAMAGASLTFGLLLFALALGLSVAAPSEPVLRFLKLAGGALLIWLAIDGLRSGHTVDPTTGERRALHPTLRGSLAIVLNPGAWLFLATAASSLFAAATEEAGTAGALLAALALMVGLAVGDGAVVLIGGLGLRRASERIGLWVRRVLAGILAGLGGWLIVDGVN